MPSLSIGVVGCVLLTAAVAFTKLAASRPQSRARTFLWIAAGLGSAFLVVKGFELGIEIESGYLPTTSGFWAAYHALTSVHALFVLVAIVVNLVLAGLGSRRSVETTDRFAKRASAAARYWQFVWLVWICLFVALYLCDRGQISIFFAHRDSEQVETRKSRSDPGVIRPSETGP